MAVNQHPTVQSAGTGDPRADDQIGTGAALGGPGAPDPSHLDEMFSILSHELRSPLTTIKGSARTLLRHGATLDPAASRQLLEDIDHEANRLHRLVDNLLELARAGDDALRTEEQQLDVLLRRVVAESAPAAASRTLRARIPTGLPPIRIDAVRIEQVVRNLVDNAVKFSPPEATIDVVVSLHRDSVAVTVRDDGYGIPPEYVGRVFDRFFRVEPAGRSVAGAGLGLAICRRFVELHGGEISVESRPGRGTAIRFSLPLPGAESGPNADPAAQKASP